MSDFEMHPRSTIKELSLSRDLAHEIEQTIGQFSDSIPNNVLCILKEHYALTIESELLQ